MRVTVPLLEFFNIRNGIMASYFSARKHGKFLSSVEQQREATIWRQPSLLSCSEINKYCRGKLFFEDKRVFLRLKGLFISLVLIYISLPKKWFAT